MGKLGKRCCCEKKNWLLEKLKLFFSLSLLDHLRLALAHRSCEEHLKHFFMYETIKYNITQRNYEYKRNMAENCEKNAASNFLGKHRFKSS